MTSQTQTLRDEYESLHGGVELLRSVADAVQTAPLQSLQRGVEAVCRFLSEDVLPLSSAEAQAQYPIVNRLLGAPQATAPMHAECESLRRLTGELFAIRVRLISAEAVAAEANNLRGVLYGLHEVLKVHLTSALSVYLPLLDSRLSPGDTHKLLVAMDAAERRARTV
jgi:hypothetical protein